MLMNRDGTMVKIIKDLDEVMEFAWELSQDERYASYPRMDSFARLKIQLEKATILDNYRILAYFNKDVLSGVCLYFWISEENYAQTVTFLIKDNYEQIATEFTRYIGEELPGYELFIGIPSTNKSALTYFSKNQVLPVENSVVTRMCHLEPRTFNNCSCIVEITKDNFEDYAIFHDQYAIPQEMYYASSNLLNEIEHFRIFVFQDAGGIHGSIFAKVGKELSDIVGLFVDEKHKYQGIESNLINELLVRLYEEFGAIKEILFFIDEDSAYELDIALAAGFRTKEKYRLYKYKL